MRCVRPMNRGGRRQHPLPSGSRRPTPSQPVCAWSRRAPSSPRDSCSRTRSPPRSPCAPAPRRPLPSAWNNSRALRARGHASGSSPTRCSLRPVTSASGGPQPHTAVGGSPLHTCTAPSGCSVGSLGECERGGRAGPLPLRDSLKPTELAEGQSAETPSTLPRGPHAARRADGALSCRVGRQPKSGATSMKVAIIIALVPGLLALGFFTIRNLERMVLYALLPAMLYPTTLLQPGGTQIAIADLLLIVVISAWLVAYSVGTAPGPWLHGNRFFLPAVAFTFVNLASVTWTSSPRSTLTFVLQLIEFVVVLPLVTASLISSLRSLERGFQVIIAASCLISVIGVVGFLPNFGSNGEAE